MALSDVQLREAAQNLPVVRVFRDKSVLQFKNVQACLWNEKTGDVLSLDDEDVGEGYVVAIAIGVK